MNDRHRQVLEAAGVDPATVRPNHVGIAYHVVAVFDDDLHDEWACATQNLAVEQAQAIRAAEPDPRFVIVVREVHCGGPEGIVPTGIERRF